MCLGNFFCAVFLFAVNPGPHLIELESPCAKVAEYAILIVGADFPDFHEHAHHGFLGNSRHADSGTYGTAFDQAANNLCACLRIKAIHDGFIVLKRFSIWQEKNGGKAEKMNITIESDT